MNLYKILKSSKDSNILLVSPEGYGKTTQLKNLCHFLAEDSCVVPIYVDLDNPAVISHGILLYILQNYCGTGTEDSEDKLLRLEDILNKKVKSSSASYSFVILIDHFESAIQNAVYARTNNEILQLAGYENCTVVAASTYYDKKTFSSFITKKLCPLKDEKVIRFLKEHSSLSNPQRINNALKQMLSIPQNLVDFVALSNTHSEDYISDIKTDLDLLSKKFCSDKYKEQEILSECLPKLAYLCSKAGNKIVAISDVSYLFKKGGSLPFRSRVRYALNHLFENDNDKLERLNRVAKSYGAGELVVDSNSSVCSFKFSCNLYRDFFAAEHYANVILEQETLEDLSCLNECIINEQIARIIAYNLKEHKNWITDILSLISKTNRENCLDNLSEPSEYIFLTTNMVNILYYFKNSFEYSDFIYLDLRLCNFIGKNCKYAFFNHAFLSDQNFVGVEPDNSNLFAVSENGEYFATGNSGVVNIRSAKYPMVIYRIITDEDKLSAVYFSGNEEVKAVGEKYIFVYNIKENFLQRCEKTDDNIVDPEINDNYNKISEEIKALGKIRYFKEHFAIIQTDADSYYGFAYLLFDVNEDKLLSCHSLFVNKGAYWIAYDHDSGEVEFIPDNDGKPLRTICYNEKTNSIYYKQYPSMIGRKVSYSNGTSIYFDTDDFDSYLKYFFFPFQKKSKKCENDNFHISNVQKNIFRDEDAYDVIIHSKSFRFAVRLGALIGVFHDNLFRKGKGICCNYELSCADYEIIVDEKCGAIFKNIFDNKFNILLDWVPYCYLIDRTTVININKQNNNYILHIYNDVWSIKIDDDEKIVFELIKQYDLTFIPDYLFAIEMFPWEDIIKEAHYMCGNRLSNMIFDDLRDIVVSRLNEILSRTNRFSADSIDMGKCSFAFSSYIATLIYDNNLCINEITNQRIIDDFKKWCLPGYDGVKYYNGHNTCYINDNTGENQYLTGCHFTLLRNELRFTSKKIIHINGLLYYKMYSVYKSSLHNGHYAPKIPFANLDIYKADLKDSKGLSGGVEEYVLSHTKIYTRNVN